MVSYTGFVVHLIPRPVVSGDEFSFHLSLILIVMLDVWFRGGGSELYISFR